MENNFNLLNMSLKDYIEELLPYLEHNKDPSRDRKYTGASEVFSSGNDHGQNQGDHCCGKRCDDMEAAEQLWRVHSPRGHIQDTYDQLFHHKNDTLTALQKAIQRSNPYMLY